MIRRGRRWPGLALPVLLTATMIAAACGDDTDSNDSGDNSGDSAVREVKSVALADESTRDALSRGVSPPATGASGDSPGFAPAAVSAVDRKIIFTANLALTADDVGASFVEVERLARTAGGFVEKSSLTNRTVGDEVRPFGSISVRVPANRYQDVLTSLRALPGAKLDHEESGSNEVTDEYTDLQSRLRNLQQSEAQYLRLLEQAKTIQEILTVNERVDGIRAQIEQIQGRVKLLDDLTDYATITATLSPALPAKAQSKDSGPKSPADAFADAWAGAVDASRYAAAAGAVILVGAIWLAIPVGLALGGVRLASRRRGSPAA